MSYRAGNNAADRWRSYCSENRELLEFIGIPRAALRNEKEFRALMIRGESTDENGEFAVRDLSDEQLHSIWRFVNQIVPFDMDVTQFDGFNDEYRGRFFEA